MFRTGHRYWNFYIFCMLVIMMIAGCGFARKAPVPHTSSTDSPSLTSVTSFRSSSTSSAPQFISASHDGMAILVNKQHALPDEYEPDDLVDPKVRFIFREKSEKRLMRREAARALERMFAGAEKDGIYLAGVSAYRSHAAQTWIYRQYVKKHGKEQAMSYSAEPGHSEHKTGLAIDVSGSDGKCAVQDCFAGSAEAEWIARHSPEYGFILRYPKGKEAITGYQYEPWHLRYVGVKRAAEMAERKLTLEEYVYETTPVLSGKERSMSQLK
ncbi:M15 family metallopeptidase [Paenibacillus apiarius]|uniref:M15 family metallopeptidase n=1 Tax=Paenibacillus apiarius TaxID=46240 RepID=A0ABT4DYM5_9BACL|nr:M15 family metallopeptidase [Paenibacillus apiarius]MCY9514994.1 M15 family metallopeptidase [Paenibacillus apiarius]MCY9522431.1 M15 family metallopeptidase [Paenibacillus apiarius]MCY9552149.1 M15 family metallopeptidase [Paenibacillus apiarius]MCY9561064.1 M15 family metallopeptidase [Paenibacillus apiarius]MCY9686295.1 M15 family metallopeptidase [Paenibacillus apiarius]